MAIETTAILRQLLFQALRSNDIDDIRDAIAVMCTKDDIAAVKEQLAEAKEREKK